MSQWVSASQLNQWAFCSRQFWLAQVVGMEPDRGTLRRLGRGVRRHQDHGRAASRARVLDRVAMSLLVLVALALAVLLLAGAAAPPGPQLPAELALPPRVLLPLAGLGVLAAVALLLRSLARGLHGRTGLPERAEILASDTGQNRVALLRDFRLGLVGKPDYVLRERSGLRSRIVPVEVKPSRRSRRLYAGDELQALAYVLLLRAAYGRRAASYGYVVYADARFRVELTRARRRELRRLIRKIRRARAARNVHRSHDEPARCLRCAFRTRCGESLA